LAKTASAFETKLASATQVWHRLGELQQEKWAGDERRWADIDIRMQKLEERTFRVAEEVACQDAKSASRFETVLKEVIGRTQSTMNVATHDLAATMKRASEDMIESLKKTQAEDLLILKRHFDRRIVGVSEDCEENGSDGNENEEHLHALMRKFGAQMDNGVSSYHQAEFWHGEVKALKDEKEEKIVALEKSKEEKEEKDKIISERDEQIVELMSEIAEKDKTLNMPVSWKRMRREVQSVEKNGHVRIDIQAGEIDVVGGVDFKPLNPTDRPIAEFRNEEEAEKALADLAQLLVTFRDVEVCVESHLKPAKGPPAFWESVAGSRAELVGDRFAKIEAKPALITTIGLPGEKGLNRNLIKVKLEMFGGFKIKHGA